MSTVSFQEAAVLTHRKGTVTTMQECVQMLRQGKQRIGLQKAADALQKHVTGLCRKLQKEGMES